MTNESASTATEAEPQYSVFEWFASYQALGLPVYRATSEDGTDWIRMRLDALIGAVSMPSRLADGLTDRLPHAPVIHNVLTDRTIALVARGRTLDEQIQRRLTSLGVTVFDQRSTVVLPSTSNCPFQWTSNRPARGLRGTLFPTVDEILGLVCPMDGDKSHG